VTVCVVVEDLKAVASVRWSLWLVAQFTLRG
jgi:hypothetical protein